MPDQTEKQYKAHLAVAVADAKEELNMWLHKKAQATVTEDGAALFVAECHVALYNSLIKKMTAGK